MKILYLKLKNYIGIYNGINRTEIELDFSKSKNKFVMLVGANGSGKSTIENALHPFSSNIEEKPTFIRPNKDGYKEIHIKTEEAIYIIKHYYKATKTGHSVKSYISQFDGKEEIELNPNGNVESFLEQVLIHLKVDFGFLKLTSLGRNIINFIDMKDAERKRYIGTLLESINAYEKYHRRVNETAKKYNNLLKNLVYKIDSIENKDHINSQLLYVENIIEEKTNLKNSLLTQIGYINSTLNNFDNLEEIKKTLEAYDILLERINQIKYLLLNIDKNFKDSHLVNIPDYKKQLNMFINKLNKNEIQLSGLNKELFYANDNYTKINTKISSLINTKNIESDNFELNSLLNMESEYLDFIKKFDKQFKDKKAILTKSELQIIENVIDNISKNIDTCLSQYSTDVIQNSFNIDIMKTSITIKNKISSIESDIIELEQDLKELTNNKMRYNQIDSLRPKECKIDDCSFIKDAMQFKDVIKTIPKKIDRLEELRSKLNKLNDEQLFYNDCVSAQSDIRFIVKQIESNSSLLEKIKECDILIDETKFMFQLTNSYFDFSNIKSKLFSMYSVIQDYEEYILIKNEKLPKLQELINKYKENVAIDKHIKELEKEAKTYNDIISKISTDIDLINIENHGLNKYIERHSKFIDSMELLKETLKDFSIVKKDYDKYHKNMDIIKDSDNKLKSLNKEIKNIDIELTSHDKRRDDLIHKKKTLKELKDEKEMLLQDYEEIGYIKDACSNTKGIPLIFINIYLEETKNIANKLMDMAFKGEFYIEDFVINETTFKIPCGGKGERNEDIKYASAGEQLIISLALSFSLIQQSNYLYNILLLDEMDSELDKKNRKMFLHILEKQSSVIDSEQIFVITHNNEFDSYPCDLILLKGHDVEDFNNKNIIFQY